MTVGKILTTIAHNTSIVLQRIKQFQQLNNKRSYTQVLSTLKGNHTSILKAYAFNQGNNIPTYFA